MRPIGLAVLLILSLTLAPLAVEAQPTRTPRIGLLRNGNPTTVSPQREAFRRGLRELDWIEGQLVIKDRKSTRLNSSHVAISYAVFCLKKKKYDIIHKQAVVINDLLS